jgi:cell wall-associated NlpC family hydrolase
MQKELVNKYLGKKYGAGTQSCLLFVKDFYRSEFGIDIPADYFEMLRVMKVTRKEPKLGDVVLIKNHTIVINHLGIYLDDNEFLQSGASAEKDEVVLSRIYERPWKERIQGYLRHPNNDTN